jgi:membrane protein DedA with SNARE-associated domain
MASEAAAAGAEQPHPELSASARRAIVLGAVISTSAGALSTALLPYLWIEHPIWLLMLSSDGRNLVLVAPQIELPLLLLVAVPRRAIAMLATYGLGMVYGRTMIDWSARKFPRLGRVFATFERLFLRFRRTLLMTWPTYTTAALGGVTRTPLRAFLPWMLIGQVAYVLVSFYIGAALSEWIDKLNVFFARHLWESTAVFATLVAIQQLVAFIRRRRAAKRLILQETVSAEP